MLSKGNRAGAVEDDVGYDLCLSVDHGFKLNSVSSTRVQVVSRCLLTAGVTWSGLLGASACRTCTYVTTYVGRQVPVSLVTHYTILIDH